MSVRIKSLLLAIPAILLLAGCGSSPPGQPGQPTSTSMPGYAAAATPTPAPSPTPIGPLGAPNCQPASPSQPSGIAGPEIEGTSANASLWALLFNDLQVGKDVKIVWRMTGSGDFQLVAIGPRGQRLAPTWGPEAHSSSNWNRPGDEWGAGFNLPTAGCWDLHASRSDASGDVWLMVTS